MESISAAFAALTGALNLAQSLNATSTTVAINAVKIELQQALLSAQQAMFTAQQEITAADSRARELEQQIVSLKDWSAEKPKYELQQVESGAVVFVLKEGMREGQPAHWLCPHCFEDGKKSVFQPQIGKPNASSSDTEWKCHGCKATFVTDWHTKPVW